MASAGRWFSRRLTGTRPASADEPPPPAPLLPAPPGAWGALLPEGASACAVFRERGLEQYALGPSSTVHVGRTVNPLRALTVPLQQGARPPCPSCRHGAIAARRAARAARRAAPPRRRRGVRLRARATRRAAARGPAPPEGLRRDPLRRARPSRAQSAART